MTTLILNRSQIEQLLDPIALLEPLRSAFQGYSLERTLAAQRIPAPLPGQGSAMILVPGLAARIPAYTVKVHAKFPGQTPAIRGVLLLHDLETGALLAIMDSTYLTAVRTGLAAALATDILARKEAGRVAIIGAGVQGEYQLRYLSRLRPVHSVKVFDLASQQAETFRQRLGHKLNLPINISNSIAESVQAAEIILTATWSREPFLHPGMIQPGAHITTLGADQPGKAEVAGELLQQALFVCDDRELAVEMGALAGVGLGPEAVGAELGEILAGVHPGRTNADQITVYGSVGLAFQDLVAGWQVYQAAQQAKLGLELDFLQ
jgi:ornithine cyclodeaminase